MIMILSTVDELGQGAWKDVWATSTKSQACKVTMTTLHMSGNHKESSHPKKVQNDAYLILTTEREGGGREWGRQPQSERAKHTRAEVDLNSRAVKPRHHLQTSQPLCTPATGQATDQHCFAFNVT